MTATLENRKEPAEKSASDEQRELAARSGEALHADAYREDRGASSASRAASTNDRPNPISADGKTLLISPANYSSFESGAGTTGDIGYQNTRLRSGDQNAKPTPDGQSVVPQNSGGEQAATAQQKLEQAQRLLTNESMSSGDKLRVVNELAQAGITHIQLPDKDGKWREYSIREQGLGDKKMVHLFANDDQGKEHIVLRGLLGKDGSVQQETDRRGRQVNLEGDWWTQHMRARTAFSAAGNAVPADTGCVVPSDSYGFYGDTSWRQNYGIGPGGIYYDPQRQAIPNYYEGRENPEAANLREMIAQAGIRRGRQGSVGQCARGVREALGALGYRVESNGSATGMRANISSDPHWVQVGTPQRGDLIFRDHGPAGRARYGGRNPGDVGIYLGNGMQANDHIQPVKPNGSYYSSMQFYRFIG